MQILDIYLETVENKSSFFFSWPIQIFDILVTVPNRTVEMSSVRSLQLKVTIIIENISFEFSLFILVNNHIKQ